MASPFSTNELFLRSDRIAFGKIPPEVPSREERLLIVPDLPGYKLFFGLSSLISTSGITGTLEDIYPQNASFTFDNFNKRLGINVSSPQYTIDISTTTGVRITGGTLIANAFGLQSVPTAALVSTLPSYVFAPGSIPPSAFASTGSINGISVATSALFSTLPTKLFSPNTIPLTTLQSTGIVYASSFIANSFYGDGFNISNIPLANINGEITGNFFKPNSFPLSTLASTGQIWIRDGSLFVPYLSAGQELVSSIVANFVSTQRLVVGSVTASSFTAGVLNFTNLSSFTLATSSIVVSGGIAAGSISGNGGGLTNLNPAALNTVIPSDKFGYRLIAWEAINPYGPFQWIAGTVTFQTGAPVTVKGTLNVEGATTLNTVVANLYTGNGAGLFNLNAVSSLSLTSSLIGLGSINYISSSQLQSTVVGLSNLISSCIDDNELQSTLIGLGTFGYVSTSQLTSTVSQLTNDMISTTRGTDNQLISTTAGLNFYVSSFIDVTEVTSTIIGLGTFGYVSTSQLTSTVSQVTNNMISTTMGTDNQLISTTQGTDNQLISSVSQVTSNLFSTTRGTDNQLISSVSQVTSNLFSTTRGTDNQLISSVSQVTSNLFSTTQGTDNQLISSISQVTSNLFSTTRGIDNQLISTTRGTDNQLISSVSQLNSNLFSTTRGTDNQLISSVSQLNSNLFSTTRGTDNQLISSVSQVTSNLFSTTRGEDNQLISTTAGLAFYVSSFIDVPELTSTIIGLGSAGFVSTIGLDAKLASTVTGLGSANYISTLSLVSSIAGLQSTIDIAFSSYSTAVGGGAGEIVRSTVEGLGSAGYVSTLSLVSTVSQLTSNLLSTTIGSDNQLISTTAGLNFYISSFIDVPELTSTIVGLGSAGFVSTIGLDAKLASTVTGLGSSDYVSTLSLVSTVSQLTSNLLSTTIGEDNQLISTTAGLHFYISSFIDVPELTSTIIGLGSLGFISSIGLDAKLASTVTGLGSADYISTLSLVSTVAGFQSTLDTSFSTYSTAVGPGGIDLIRSTVTGLGSIGYISSSQLLSTTAFLQNEIEHGFSTLSTAIQTSPGYNAQTLYLNESVDVAPYKQLGAEEVITGTLYSTIVSVPGNTTGNLLSAFQSDFPLPSFMPAGIWDLNLFADAGAANAISMYYSLFFRASGGSETLLFQSATVPIGNTGILQYKNSLPVSYTPIPNGSTMVLKVFGSNQTGPAVSVTSYFQNGYYSHVHTTFDSVAYSGGSGVSSLSTVVASNYDYFSSLFVSTNLNLFSTVEGLGSIGYVSTLSLVSTVAGFQSTLDNSFSTYSTAVGPGGIDLIRSTVTGLGSIGYVSTLSMYSSINSAISSLSTAYGAIGGGSGGLASIPSTLSTFAILTSSLLASTIATGEFTTNPNFLTLQYPKRDPSTFFLYSLSTGYLGIGTSSPSNVVEIKDWTDSNFTNSVLSVQAGQPGIAPIASNYYYYTATQPTYTVPSNVYRLQVHMWGGGGGGGSNGGNGSVGGGAAYVAGFIDVTPGQQFYLRVAGGGGRPTGGYGGGGNGNAGGGGGGGGGATSFIQVTGSNTLAIVGGGGGGGAFSTSNIGGGATFSGVGFRGGALPQTQTVTPSASFGGGGDSNAISPTPNGATGTWPGSNGTAGQGGAANQSAGGPGGGGGGYVGGGGGGLDTFHGSGGGGSSYSGGFYTVVGENANGSTSGGSNALRIASANPSAGSGSTAGNTSGFNGLIAIVEYGTTSAKNAKLINLLTNVGATASYFGSDGSLGLNTSNITTGYTLDVNGPALMKSLNVSSLSTGVITNSLRIGTLSSVTSINYNGLLGNYNNTVLAEISTGAGTQELLLFKGSSASDRVRIQTTGTFVVETGVSARLWSTNTIPTQSNITPAFIINSSSNVGIQTATPGTALDVAGTARAITLSSQQLFVSTLNGGNPLVNAVTTNSMVALTYNSNAFTYDGNQWIRGSGIGNQVHGLAYNGSLWVSGTEAGIYSSADGINWGATSFTGTPTSGVAWNGSLWVVGGWYGGMWFSYDGYTWTACPQAPPQAIQDIAWGKDKFIAACAAAVYYSYDGLYWYNLGNILVGGDQTYCVAYNGRQWLIGGRNASVNNIAYSYDGLNWIGTGGNSYNINDLAWSGRIWVATTGTNQTVLSSPDGITWTARTNTNYTDLGGGSVTWNGSFFYVASGNSFIYLSRSTDGITWTSLGTIAGQQIRKIKARYVLPLDGAQEAAGIYAQNIFLGISTNQTVLRFPGGDGLYRNTVIGEISSTETRFAQELVLFKGSTINDRIRLQTTGEIRFEAGVPSRFFSSISSIAPVVTPAFLISTNSNVGIGTALPAATLDVVGTGRFQTVSTLNINFSTINGQVFGAPINSTVVGLGSAGYISSTQLLSTTFGLENFVSTSIQAIPFVYAGATLYLNYSVTAGTYKALENVLLDAPQQTQATLVTGNTSNNLIVGFQSDFSLPGQIPGGIWTIVLFCQASGLNLQAYVSLFLRDSGGVETLVASNSTAPQVIPTVLTELIVTLPVPSTTIPPGDVLVLKIFANNVAAPNRTLTLYFENGTYSYVQTTFGVIVDNSVLTSTINGLGQLGYVSTASLTSTVTGLGSIGYVSSLSLVSTVAGLQSTINNSFSTYSTAVGPGGIDLIRSTVTGLGSIGYISSSQLFSTVIGLGQIYSSTMGGSSPSTLSTSAFFTSSILASTTQTSILSTQQLFASSIVTNNLLASTSMISTFSTNNINFAAGFGYLTMPDIYPNSVYTSSVTTSNLLVGVNSVVSPIQFYGFGTYSNSVIAELSTGATTQELVFFRGSNATDRVRTQTTGSIIFEAGVSARIWPTVNSNATPSLIINTNSNVGIQTANPLFPLDVAGVGRFTTVSTLALNVSSVNGLVYPPSGGASGAVPFVSAFTVSTGFLSVSSISTNIFTANVMSNLQFQTSSISTNVLFGGNITSLQIQTSSISTNVLFGGNINSLQIQTSSLIGITALLQSTQITTISSASVYGSTFTGKWNDAQFYVLQTI